MNELGFIPVSVIPVIWIVAAYLLGSIAFGILVSKLFGLPDPRTVGSGNPGATNVLRSGKKMAAALTLLGDAFKGLVSCLAGATIRHVNVGSERGWVSCIFWAFVPNFL